MKKALKTTTARCRQCGRYFFRIAKTRPPIYCDECAEWRKVEGNRYRQRAYRARRCAAKHAAENSQPTKATQPVLWSSREGYRATLQRGLFANMPEPKRTHMRKAAGLP